MRGARPAGAAVVGVLLLLWALPALAGSVAPAVAAVRAADAHDRWCSDVHVGKATAAAEAVAKVGPVLVEVSRVYDQTGAGFLLYWRGMLNHCLNQEERAVADLQAFVALAGDQAVYVEQVREARRRLRGRARVSSSSAPAPSPVGVVAGASLLAAGGVLGGLSGWQGGLVSQAQADWDAGRRPYADLAADMAAGQEAVGAANGLLVGAVACGVGGALSFVITAATAGSSAGGSKVTTSPQILGWPLPEGGAALGVVGRW